MYSILPQKSSTIFTKLHKPSMVTINHYTNPINRSHRSLFYDHLKNQRLDKARIIFEKIPSPGVHLYTMMIDGYAKNNRLFDALALFDKMSVRDVVSWNSMIKGCLDCGHLGKARNLFGEMPERNVVSWTTMFDGYLKFGRVEEAERMFWEMPGRDVAAWNAMIYGYFQNGKVEDGLELFEKMPCRNVISWTSVIGGLDQCGKSREGLLLYIKMIASGIVPTSSTFACVLTACANVADFRLGIQVHGHVLKSGYCFVDEYISGSLITFYANCNKIESGHKVFEETLIRNVVVWTALITGYGSNCMHEDALRIFQDMKREGVLPNESTFTSALSSCCGLESLDKGKELHALTIKLGLKTQVFVGNSLVVMYTDCGNIYDALAAFKGINEKNVVSWNSIIVGSAQHGFGVWTLTLFSQMIRAGVGPDEITLTGLLSSCGRTGMLQKGRRFFEYITRYKSTFVNLQHYACMVDILGRAGNLEEAEELIKNIPLKADSMVWLALLSACRVHSNLEVAERVANKIFNLEPHCSGAYVLLSNLYASASKWSEVSEMRQKMKEGGVAKQPGFSWVILKGQRHEFLSGDRSHPLSEKIYEKLDWLRRKMKEFGYISDEHFALHDVEDEQKEEMLSYHSERLAIGFGLVSTMEGSTITVMKNLRVCGDCHSAIKFISAIVGREIIVRDSSRFHHFKSGSCSCGDYW